MDHVRRSVSGWSVQIFARVAPFVLVLHFDSASSGLRVLLSCPLHPPPSAWSRWQRALSFAPRAQLYALRSAKFSSNAPSTAYSQLRRPL